MSDRDISEADMEVKRASDIFTRAPDLDYQQPYKSCPTKIIMPMRRSSMMMMKEKYFELYFSVTLFYEVLSCSKFLQPVGSDYSSNNFKAYISQSMSLNCTIDMFLCLLRVCVCGGGLTGRGGQECSRLMNGQRALDILDCRVIGHRGDILMAAPRKTMGSGGCTITSL